MYNFNDWNFDSIRKGKLQTSSDSSFSSVAICCFSFGLLVGQQFTVFHYFLTFHGLNYESRKGQVWVGSQQQMFTLKAESGHAQDLGHDLGLKFRDLSLCCDL